MNLRPVLLSLCASSMLLAPITLNAAETNPNIVHRQGIMKSIGGNVTSLKSILVLGFDAQQDVSYHAQSIIDSWDHLGDSFPPDSQEGKTKAKKAIWEDMDTFKQQGKDMRAAAQALIDASGEKSTSIAAFKDLAGTCKACHDDFKKKN